MHAYERLKYIDINRIIASKVMSHKHSSTLRVPPGIPQEEGYLIPKLGFSIQTCSVIWTI